MIYGIVEKKANSISFYLEKEIKQTERQLREVNERLDTIYAAYRGYITIEQFKAQNERIAQEQKVLTAKKSNPP